MPSNALFYAHLPVLAPDDLGFFVLDKRTHIRSIFKFSLHIKSNFNTFVVILHVLIKYQPYKLEALQHKSLISN